jgi:serine/threonine protein phosphatase PrpC
VHRVTVEPGDLLLLCSDGLYEPVPPEVLVEQLARGGTPQEMIDRLVTQAYDLGSQDNITGVLVRVL